LTAKTVIAPHSSRENGHPGPDDDTEPPSRTKRTAFAAIALLALAGLIALGVWQIQRRSWKLALIERVEQRIHAVPVPPPTRPLWPSITAAAYEYLPVRAAGVFLHDLETQVQASTVHGAGVWVITPLRAADGSVILVNRGFAPLDRRDPATRRAGSPPGEVTVTGLLRLSEPGGGFLRNNDPAADRWHSRDVAAIASARGLEQVAPYFIDADATPNPAGIPIGGLTVVGFRNHHLLYAATWFTLAAALGGAMVHTARTEVRRRRPSS
jgi:surfeit locus 1 family protein